MHTIRGNKSIQFESRQLNERKVNHMDYIDEGGGAFEKQKTLSVPVRNCSMFSQHHFDKVEFIL